MTLRPVPNSRGAQAGPVRHRRLVPVGARHRRRSCSASTRVPSRAGPTPLTLAGLFVGVVALVAFVVWELRQDAAAAGHPPVPPPRPGRRVDDPADRVRRDVRHLPGAGAVHCRRCSATRRCKSSAGAAADGRGDDAAVDDRADDRRPLRRAHHADHRRRRSSPAVWRCWPRWCRSTGGYLSILPGLVLVSVGIGLCMTPSTTAITELAPPRQQGVASALNDTVRELGGAVGIALLGSGVAPATARACRPPPTACRPSWPAGCRRASARRSPSAGDLGPSAPQVLDAAREALVDGWRFVMWFGVGIALVAVTYLVVRGPRTEDLADEDVLDAYEAELDLEPVPG